MGDLLLGIDVGTYSSKGVLCRPDGEVVDEARADHELSVPRPGWAEHDADRIWWGDLVAIARRLTARLSTSDRIAAVAVSAIGPCLLPIDATGRALRPAILYGIDVRAAAQIDELERRYGREALVELGGMRLTSQAVGPKILWLREHEPDIYESAAQFLTATSYLVRRLTGETVIDRHTASHFNPLIDLTHLEWDERFAEGITDLKRLPNLRWSNEIVGVVTKAAAAETGIPSGTLVTAGTVDALAEAVSVGVVDPGDLMLMYGSTAFLILVVDRRRSHPDLWATAGAFPGSYALAAGMATTGSATTWFRNEFGRDLREGAGPDPYAVLAAEAAASPPGSRGLLFLPYLSGERTPIHDPNARGVLAGLSIGHSRGDVYRALLEGVAYGIRHNLDTMTAAGAPIERIVAVGGGTANQLWLQIVSDATGRSQVVPRQTIGAAYGDAFLAGYASGLIRDRSDLSRRWVQPGLSIEPGPNAKVYRSRYPLFADLYLGSRPVVHRLAALAADEDDSGNLKGVQRRHRPNE
jgi:xylulokinase